MPKKPIPTESLEEFLRRGGKIERLQTPDYEQPKTSRYKLKDLAPAGETGELKRALYGK